MEWEKRDHMPPSDEGGGSAHADSEGENTTPQAKIKDFCQLSSQGEPRLSKNMSLRTSPQAGVAISKLFRPVFDNFRFYLGDSHASVSTGSE